METLLENPDLKTARRERRALKRRAEILDAALRVFERDGYEAASTRMIAEEADVSEGTIYNYFPDKGELCIQALRHGSGLAALVAHTEIMDGPIEDVLAAISAWRRENIPRQAAMLEIWAEMMASPKLRQRYDELMWQPAVAAVEAALTRRGEALAAPPPIVARLLLSSLLGMSLMGLADPALREVLTSEPDALNNVHELLWRGLGPPRT